jgi:hypothetical protein
LIGKDMMVNSPCALHVGAVAESGHVIAGGATEIVVSASWAPADRAGNVIRFRKSVTSNRFWPLRSEGMKKGDRSISERGTDLFLHVRSARATPLTICGVDTVAVFSIPPQ